MGFKKGDGTMVAVEIINDFFELLNTYNLKYVLIKNDDNAIPRSVNSGDDIDLLIHPSEYDRLIEIAKNNGYEKIVGESCKSFFLYQLRDDILLKKEDCYFHFFEALACTPLTNMGRCKMALENEVQKYIWKNRVWDQDSNWWIMDDISILLYLIVRSVFDKKVFREKYIREIEKRIHFINDKSFVMLARTVFWGFTPQMISMVTEKKYDEILNAYLAYSNY